MNLLETKMIELNDCLQNYCQPLFKTILKPLNESEIINYLKICRIEDSTIKEIFKLANGVEYDLELPTSAFDYTGFGVIPTLGYISEVINLESNRKRWSESFFPLVASFQGDFLLFETKSNSKSYGQLFLHSPSLGYVDFHVSYFDSFFTMVDTINECFISKTFIYNSEEMFLEIDHENYFKIAKKFNPKSEYWISEYW
jgi:hypothetical protein